MKLGMLCKYSGLYSSNMRKYVNHGSTNQERKDGKNGTMEAIGHHPNFHDSMIKTKRFQNIDNILEITLYVHLMADGCRDLTYVSLPGIQRHATLKSSPQ